MKYVSTDLIFGKIDMTIKEAKVTLTHLELPPVKMLWWNQTSMSYHDLKDYFKEEYYDF